MALQARYIATGAWLKANEATDGSAVRWSEQEALHWINNGQREIVNQSPRANPVRALVTFSAGTRQNLLTLGNADAVQLIDVVRNYDASNNPGRPITKGDRSWLDDTRPDWHTQAAAAEAELWLFDNLDPLSFYISPAVVTGAKGEIVYAAMPADVTDLDNLANLSSIYGNALEAFLLYSFFSKDAPFAGKNAGLAAQYYQLFLSLVAVRGQNAQSGDQASSQKAAS